MKRIAFFTVFTVVMMLFVNNKTAAQCNDYGATFDCYSYSNSISSTSSFEAWEGGGYVFWVYVKLQTTHPTWSVAGAEIATDADYWEHTISQGTYEDDFTVAGSGYAGSFSLYTQARYGQAYIRASW